MARHHAGDGKIEAVGNELRVLGARLHVFGIAAPGMHPKQAGRRKLAVAVDTQRRDDAVADLAIGHVGPEPGHDAGWIDARHPRQRHRPRVLSGAHDQVERAVHRHGMDADQHLARTRLRIRDLLHPHHVGRTELTNDDRLQGNLLVALFLTLSWPGSSRPFRLILAQPCHPKRDARSSPRISSERYPRLWARRWRRSGMSFSALAPVSMARQLEPSPRTAST